MIKQTKSSEPCDEIEFEFESWSGVVAVLADRTGGNIQLFDLEGRPVVFGSLCSSDQSRIRAKIREWIDHYKALEEQQEPHPAASEFGSGYVDWINRGCP